MQQHGDEKREATRDGGFHLENLLESLIYKARWILVVFYVVLVVALAGFAAKFATIFWHYITHVFELAETDTLIELLGLVDMTLLANLILIVIFSGYENFVSIIGVAVNSPDRPKWMGEVDFSGLKLKLIGSMVALSGIKLLGTFLSIPAGGDTTEPGRWSAHDTHLAWMVVIHLTFVVTGVLYAWSERLSHKPGKGH
ncbi:MAG: hypothetical protein RLZZ393_947 [Pseudomonadota bacterium]|jgi:uncharacterized protein (TIGR00645 family)